MWSDDSGDTSSDDASLLDEEIEKTIKANLDLPLTLPTPCPVCSSCGFASNRFRLFSDFKALRQHASERVRDRCPDQQKVRHLHEILLNNVDQEIEDAKVAHVMSTDVAAMVHRGNVSSETARKLDDMLHLDESVREGKRAIEDLQEKRQKKQRQTYRNVNRLQELRHSIQAYRKSAEEIREKSMKEIEKYDTDLRDLRDSQTQQLDMRRSQIDRIQRELDNSAKKMTQEKRADLRQKQQHMMQSAETMRQERELVEHQLRELQIQKANAQRDWEEAGRQKEIFNREVQNVEQQIKQSVKWEEEDQVVIKQLSLLGLDTRRLPMSCVRCKRPFQKKEDKGKEGTCERTILELCGCVDYCRTCAEHRRFKCDKHNVRAGHAIPFRTFG